MTQGILLSTDVLAWRLHAKNWLAKMWLQGKAHAANALVIAIAVMLLGHFAFRQSLPKPPLWLVEYSPYGIAALLVGLMISLHAKLSSGLSELCRDWLSAQPIPPTERIDVIRLRVALLAAWQIAMFSVVVWWSSNSQSAGLFTLLAAILSAALIAIIRPSKASIAAISSAETSRFSLSNASQTPFSAWFHSLIPGAARMRIWWLLPLLTIPMGSSVALIALMSVAFAAVLRLFALAQAINLGQWQIAQMLRSQPASPLFLYLRALKFALHALPPLSVLALIPLFAPGQSFDWRVVAASVFVTGIIGILTALHFGFAFRHLPLVALARWRASIVLSLAFGICLSSLAPVLPLLLACVWFWLFRRGNRYAETLRQ